MGKIATESEAAQKGGGSSLSNKCCTKERAESLGCKVNGIYSSNNQLVELDKLSPDKQVVGITCNSNPFTQGYEIKYILSESIDYDITVTTDDEYGINTCIIPSGNASWSKLIYTGNGNLKPLFNSIRVSPLDRLVSISILSNSYPQGYTINCILSEPVDYNITITTDDDYKGVNTFTIPSGKTKWDEMINTGNGSRPAFFKSIKISK